VRAGAVAKAMAIKAPTPPTDLTTDEEARKILFGQRARS
jgi:GSH-dependent disulfide-bond oxidoreductase